MSEIKQTNFRIDQTSADAFRAFCEEKGWNQAQGFDHLLQVLELDQAKAAVPERAFEISDFEAHVQALLGAYVQSVAMTQNTEERVRMEFSRRLESKDELIESLQADLKAANGKAAEAADAQLKLLSIEGDYAQAVADIATLQDRNAFLQRQVEQIEAGKISMERLLTGRLEAAEAMAAEADGLRAERDRLASQLRDTNQELKDQVRDHQIEMERAARAAEKAQDAAVAAEKAKGDAEASRLREVLQEVRIRASEDLRAAEERAHEADRAAAAEIRALEQRIAALQQELAMRPKAE